MTQSLSGIVPGIIDAHIHQWDPYVGALADLLAPYGPELLRKVFRDNAKAVDNL